MHIFPFVEAVQYAEDIFQDILSNIKSQNVAELLKDVENMLTQINEKDFDDRETMALEELEKAKEGIF